MKKFVIKLEDNTYFVGYYTFQYETYTSGMYEINSERVKKYSTKKLAQNAFDKILENTSGLIPIEIIEIEV